jgi:hypothetical protein
VREDRTRVDERECLVAPPVEYIKTQLAAGFSVLTHVPEGAIGTGRQDVYLLKRAASDMR